MNGSRVVVDTNVYYIFFYDPKSKSGKLLEKAIDKRIELFSPDVVKEELHRLLIRNLDFSKAQAEAIIDSLPVEWVEREVYEKYLEKAKIIKHKSDRPILACALALNCGIITTNIKDFKSAKKLVEIWKIDELLDSVE